MIISITKIKTQHDMNYIYMYSNTNELALPRTSKNTFKVPYPGYPVDFSMFSAYQLPMASAIF